MFTERQLFILQKIIELYTLTGEPVGSKSLVELSDIPVSSATVRNEMSKLEELGLLEKTHSSSGRIPSIKGYRFYVGHLLQPKKPAVSAQDKISELISSANYPLNDLFDQTATLLSGLTNYTTIIIGPQSQDNLLTDLQLLAVSSRQMLLVMEFDHLDLKSHLFKWSRPISSDGLHQANQMLRHQLIGQPLQVVAKKLKHEIPEILQRIFSDHYERKLRLMIEQLLRQQNNDRVYVSGKGNLLDFIEVMDIQKVKDLYELLDDEDELKSLLLPFDEEVNIQIGTDQVYDGLSMMTTSYHLEDERTGLIAILGPIRMSYDLNLGIMEFLKKELTKKLADDYFKED